jgi:prepilin-type N-terminal cleavage/methylation domain-containing protein
MRGRETSNCGRGSAAGARRANGFTLIELLVIVVVLGLAAALGRPLLGASTDEARLSAAAAEVAAALDYARLTASCGGRPCRVTVDATADTLAVEQLRCAVDFSDPGLDEVMRSQADVLSFVEMWHPVKKGLRYRLDFGGVGWFGGVDVASVSFGAGASVVFDACGAPSDGGSVVLERGGRFATVTLDGLTGKVTRSD